MKETIFRHSAPINEPIRNYAPGSPERASIKAKLEELGKVQAKPQQDSAAALKRSADRLDAQSKDLRGLQEELGNLF